MRIHRRRPTRPTTIKAEIVNAMVSAPTLIGRSNARLVYSEKLRRIPISRIASAKGNNANRRDWIAICRATIAATNCRAIDSVVTTISIGSPVHYESGLPSRRVHNHMREFAGSLHSSMRNWQGFQQVVAREHAVKRPPNSSAQPLIREVLPRLLSACDFWRAQPWFHQH